MSLKATVIMDTRDSSVPFLCWGLIAFIAARSGTEFEEIDGTRSARRFDTRDTFDLVKRASCKLIRERERELSSIIFLSSRDALSFRQM